ncbi:Outer membrane protein Imp, required for envelope biogenesis [Chitinispirillum alkaliphilum]|nr:Outer membrane protein Imp, required for envelope biogenesis [Chitinispirillum alkaliphilum]
MLFIIFVGTTVYPDSGDVVVSVQKSEPGITDSVSYQSDYIEYDAVKREFYLIGRAVVRYQNVTLLADTIIYTTETDQFRATGNPHLIEGNDTTSGESMVYNIRTRRGRVQYATARFDDAWFSGNQVIKSEKDELFVDEGDYTSCEYVENPHYFFYGKNIKIVPDDKIISRPVVFNIGDAPVAVLPYFIFPLDRSRRSGWLTPVWGGSPGRGGYVDNVGYYFVPNDYVDFLLSSKIQEFNYFVLNAESQYALRYVLDGKISARYVLDEDILSRSRMWSVDYRHNQMLTPDGRTRLSGRGSIVSQRNFYQRFSEDSDELQEQNLTANMTLNHRFSAINASALLRWNRTHNLVTDQIREDIPSLEFRLPNRPLFSATAGQDPSWYNKIYYSYNTRANVRRNAYGNDSLPGFVRPGMVHDFNMSAPQTLFRYITLNPTFSTSLSSFYGAIDTTVRDTNWVSRTVEYEISDISGDERYPDYELVNISPNIFINEYGDMDTTYIVTKVSQPEAHLVRDTLDQFVTTGAWQAGVNASTNLYGTFAFRLFNMTGLRHTLTPSIGYQYLPEHNLDKQFFDIGIPYTRPRERQQLLTLNIANQFQGRRQVASGDKGKTREEKFQLLSVGMSTAYDFEADNRRWRDLNLNASTSHRNVNVRFNSAFWLYDQNDLLSAPIMKNYRLNISTGSFRVRGTLWDGDLLSFDSHQESQSPQAAQEWSLSINPSFTYSASRTAPGEPFVPSKQYTLSASAGLNFTNSWSLNWNGAYNFITDQFVRNSFVLRADLECWEMQFTWRPERLNPGYHFRINIKKIPDIKWEQRG